MLLYVTNLNGWGNQFQLSLVHRDTLHIFLKGELFSVYDSRWYTPASMRHTNLSFTFLYQLTL